MRGCDSSPGGWGVVSTKLDWLQRDVDRTDSRVALVEQRQAGYPKVKTGIIPTTPEFLREALIVIGRAVIAAIVLSKISALKTFIQKNTGGCDCESH
jgi:hypothetical protein